MLSSLGRRSPIGMSFGKSWLWYALSWVVDFWPVLGVLTVRALQRLVAPPEPPSKPIDRPLVHFSLVDHSGST